MQIVIPMSGFGERFRAAGYTVPKPLIVVDGKPIVAHVVDLFPGVTDFLFICNEDHLAEPAFRMREILETCCPTGKIVGIPAHRKGPVWAVSQVMEHIAPDQPVIVNYCDFTCYWDFAHFQRFVAAADCDGAIPAYRGFHPHSLGSTYYAYLRERDGWASDIQEKKPFTTRPQEEYTSSGTYYFRSGALLARYIQRTLDEDLKVGSEYYVSLTYKPMFADGCRVAVYPLQHFMQWGTPADLEEFVRWSSSFRRLAQHRRRARQAGTLMLPMAGLGSRFAKEGYTLPKPLIPVSGLPMAVQAAHSLPEAERSVFILRRDLPGLADVEAGLEQAYPGSSRVVLDEPTDGQARTCLLGMDGVALDQPLTIGACDTGMLYDPDQFENAMSGDADLLVWVTRDHPGAVRHPQMYGWVVEQDGRITGVSVKQPLGNPATDPIITGTFTFRRAGDFVRAAERMIARGATVNGEFYVDTCIEDALALGLTCRVFEVTDYLCWGTPDDLRTFTYWQSCFTKWESHPYSLAADGMVPPGAVAQLLAQASPLIPPLPGSQEGVLAETVTSR